MISPRWTFYSQKFPRRKPLSSDAVPNGSSAGNHLPGDRSFSRDDDYARARGASAVKYRRDTLRSRTKLLCFLSRATSSPSALRSLFVSRLGFSPYLFTYGETGLVIFIFCKFSIIIGRLAIIMGLSNRGLVENLY